MNQIKRKLHSKQGASLLIAMVYLIFAVFIGGSVLAAASANGYRIEHLSDQQDYLNQRSAALMLAEEMDFGTVSNISLDARYSTTTIQPVIIKPNGEIVNNGDDVEVTYALSFKINYNGKVDALHRVMFESAILRYIEQNDMGSMTPTFQNFVYDNGTAAGETITSLDQFWTLDRVNCIGNIHITGTKGGEIFTDYTARYTSGKNDRLYDFIVDFGDFSQITIVMSGNSGTRPQRGTPEYKDSYIPIGSELEYAKRMVTEVERTVITWEAPVINKGGTAG